MKIWRFVAGILLAAGLCAPVQAQDTKSQLNTYNNAVVTSNGVGAITGATLNPLLGAMIKASCTIADPVNCPLSALGPATANQPLIGAASGGGVTQGTRSGNTTAFPTVDSTPVNGDCAVWDSSGGLNSVSCSPSGSGTVGAGLLGQLAMYPANGTSVVGTTTVIYLAAYTSTTGCKGNNAIDDSVAINAAISAAASNTAGGIVLFSAGMDCRIKNPILLQTNVQLVGMGSTGSAIIRAGTNITNMITQSNIATGFIQNVGIRDLAIDSNGFTIAGAMINAWWVNGHLEDNSITGTASTQYCVFFAGANGGNPDWINFIRGNFISDCVNNLSFTGSDSIITANHISAGSSVSQYNLILNFTGGVKVVSNQLENATAGNILIQGQPASCSSNFSTDTITGNFITQGAAGIIIQPGLCSNTLLLSTPIVGNNFFGNAQEDIYIYGGVNGGLVVGNTFNGTTPVTGNIVFNALGPGSGNTGWTVGPNTYSSQALSVINTPQDMTEVGQYMKLPGILISALPTCTSGLRGSIRYISDGTGGAAPAWHGSVVGGGSTPVFGLVSCTGSGWQWE